MPKRDYDKLKHTAKAYMVTKTGKAGKGGWGNAVEDYTQGYDHTQDVEEEVKEEYVEGMVRQDEDFVEEAEPVKRVALWDVADEVAWVNTFGSRYEVEAAKFEDCGITGEDLFSLTHEDLSETLGPGMKSRKVWVGLQNLISEALEAPPTDVQWSFYTNEKGWVNYTGKENAIIEDKYQKRQDTTMRGWKLLLTRKKPYGSYRSQTLLLQREGSANKRAAEDGPVDLQKRIQATTAEPTVEKKTWATLAAKV